jgi:hypothetical protein
MSELRSLQSLVAESRSSVAIQDDIEFAAIAAEYHAYLDSVKETDET